MNSSHSWMLTEVHTHKQHEINKPVFIVGRSAQADLILTSYLASRNHCKIFTIQDSSLLIQDLGTMNGTYVNSQKLAAKEMTAVKEGDTIIFGGTDVGCCYTLSKGVLGVTKEEPLQNIKPYQNKILLEGLPSVISLHSSGSSTNSSVEIVEDGVSGPVSQLPEKSASLMKEESDPNAAVALICDNIPNKDSRNQRNTVTLHKSPDQSSSTVVQAIKSRKQSINEVANNSINIPNQPSISKQIISIEKPKNGVSANEINNNLGSSASASTSKLAKFCINKAPIESCKTNFSEKNTRQDLNVLSTLNTNTSIRTRSKTPVNLSRIPTSLEIRRKPRSISPVCSAKQVELSAPLSRRNKSETNVSDLCKLETRASRMLNIVATAEPFKTKENKLSAGLSKTPQKRRNSEYSPPQIPSPSKNIATNCPKEIDKRQIKNKQINIISNQIIKPGISGNSEVKLNALTLQEKQLSSSNISKPSQASTNRQDQLKRKTRKQSFGEAKKHPCEGEKTPDNEKDCQNTVQKPNQFSTGNESLIIVIDDDDDDDYDIACSQMAIMSQKVKIERDPVETAYNEIKNELKDLEYYAQETILNKIPFDLGDDLEPCNSTQDILNVLEGNEDPPPQTRNAYEFLESSDDELVEILRNCEQKDNETSEKDKSTKLPVEKEKLPRANVTDNTRRKTTAIEGNKDQPPQTRDVYDFCESSDDELLAILRNRVQKDNEASEKYKITKTPVAKEGFSRENVTHNTRSKTPVNKRKYVVPPIVEPHTQTTKKSKKIPETVKEKPDASKDKDRKRRLSMEHFTSKKQKKDGDIDTSKRKSDKVIIKIDKEKYDKAGVKTNTDKDKSDKVNAKKSTEKGWSDKVSVKKNTDQEKFDKLNAKRNTDKEKRSDKASVTKNTDKEKSDKVNVGRNSDQGPSSAQRKPRLSRSKSLDCRSGAKYIQDELKRRSVTKIELDKDTKNIIKEERLKKLKELSDRENSKKTPKVDKVKTIPKVKVSSGRGTFLTEPEPLTSEKNMQTRLSTSKQKLDKTALEEIPPSYNLRNKRRSATPLLLASSNGSTPSPSKLNIIPDFVGKFPKVNFLSNTRPPSRLKSNIIPQGFIQSGDQIQTPANVNVDHVVDDMVRWLPNWLEEQSRLGQTAPANGDKPALPLPLSFEGFQQYWDAMSPLIMLEAWQHVYDSYKTNRKNPHRAIIKHTRISGSVMHMDCECYITEDAVKQNNYYKTDDFLVMEYKLKDDKQVDYRAFSFGYIKSCVRTVIQNSTIICDKIANQCPGPLHTRLTFTVVTMCRPGIKRVSSNVLLTQLIGSLANFMKLFKTAKGLHVSPIGRKVLKPKICDFKSDAGHGEYFGMPNLNREQKQIVLEASNACLSNESKIYCIKGPPGTGKSTVIVNVILQTIMSQIAKGHKSPVILVTAPSNTAIDQLVQKILEVKKALAEKKRYIKLVRLGVDSRMDEAVSDYKLQEHVLREMLMLVNEPDEYRQAHAKGMDKSTFLVQKMGQNAYNFEYYKHEEFMLRGCNIVCTTLSSCVGPKLSEAFRKGFVNFTCCIIDEAAQCTEVQSLLPTHLGIERFVLVGDPKQLPATVKNMEAKKLGLEQSLFTRIARNFEKDPRNPIRMLREQYRMHAEICSFPSRCFYEGKLRSSPFIPNPIKPRIRPYLVFSITESRNKDENKYVNMEEVDMIKKILTTLFDVTDNSCKYSVGIITPYTAQKAVIESNIYELRLREKASIDVNTVDGFQGAENDIIIISCVRDSANNFVNSQNRLNVALTRAKQALYIVCNHSLFKDCRTLYDLREDAKRRNVCLDIKDKASNLSNLRKYILQK